MAAWWDNLVFSDGSETDWFVRTAFAEACGGGPVFSCFTDASVDLDRLDAFLVEAGLKLAVDRIDTIGAGESVERIYVREDGIARVTGDASGDMYLALESFDRSLRENLAKVIRDNATPRACSRKVFVVSKDADGFRLMELGRIAAPLERGNYSEEVLGQYDHVVEDLRSDKPCGRLVLLTGEPGTGKSYLIRGLVAETTALFVFVPSGLAAELATPELLPLLIRHRHDGRPILLILEDADASLLPRSTDNIDKLSDILNFGDGLLGELADLRVIATTNAKRPEIDKALLRPGRLCKEIHVERLTPDHAMKVYERLTGEALSSLGNGTLADVYRLARSPNKASPAY